MAFGETLSLQFRVTADAKSAAKQIDDFKASANRSVTAISQGISRSFKSATKDSEGLFTALDQTRIGLEQLSRGSLGSIPNFFKAFRAFRSDVSDGGAALKILDAALVSAGARSTTAKTLFDEFRERVRDGASGIGAESQAIRAAFNALGIDITDALLRPEKAFESVLRLIGQFGPETAKGRAGLDVLGVGLGDVSTAASAAGRSLATLGAGFTGAAAAAGIAGAAIVAAIGLVVAAIVTAVVATKGMIETAKEVGTRSKEDFDKLKKNIEAAGFAVTALDRSLSQGLTKSIDRIKGGFDGLFLELIRTAGPALTALLQSVGDLLHDLAPAARLLGVILANAFQLAAGAVDLFRLSLAAAFTDLTRFLLFISNPQNLLQGIIAGFNAAQARAKKAKEDLSLEGFKDTGKAESASRTRIRILEIEAQAAQRIFNQQSEAAERAYEAQAISFEEMTERIKTAAKELFAARTRVLEAEREEAQTGDLSDSQRAVKLAEINDKILQAQQQFNATFDKLQDDANKRQEERTRNFLQFVQDAAEARRQLNQELEELALETRDVQREIDRINLGRLRESPIPAHQRQAIFENLRIETEAELDRTQQAKIAIENQRRELLERAQTQQERERIEKESNKRIEAEKQRHNAVISVLNRDATRDLERQDPLSGRSLFGDTFANLKNEQELSNIQSLAGSLKESFNQMSASAGNFKTTFVQAIQSATGALQNMLATWIQTGKTGPAAAKKFVAGVLQALSQLWLAKAIAELAEGFAALFFNPAEAASHFKSSALYFAAMAAAGVAGRAVAGDSFQQVAGGGGGAGGGGFEQQQPRQININRGGEGETLGVGAGGADLVAGGLFGQAVVAIQRVGESVSRLEQKIVEMTPGNVVAVGAGQATNEIGRAVVDEARRSAEFTNDFGRVLFGPA